LPAGLANAVREALEPSFREASTFWGRSDVYRRIAGRYTEAVSLTLERGGDPMVDAGREQVVPVACS
jgi:hypothetical protein